jgi:histone-lysine N-methyltransferase SETMAR
MAQRAYGRQAPSRSLIYKVYAELKNGEFTLTGTHAGGTCPSWELLLSIEDRITEFPCISLRKLSTEFNVSRNCVKLALVSYLNYQKKHFRWVPHVLNPEQKLARVAAAKQMLQILENDEINAFEHILTLDETWLPFYLEQESMWVPASTTSPTKVKMENRKEKMMLTVAWNAEAFILVKGVERGRTVTAEYFQQEILLPLWKYYYQTKDTSIYWIHFDNASPHTAETTQDLLKAMGLNVMPQPPYSPDISPCDFYLFGRVKREMRGRKHMTPEETQADFEGILNSITFQERIDVMEEWISRLKKVIETGGEYV